MCELYQTSKSNVSEHIKHIFEEGELEEDSVVRKFRTTGADGKKYNVIHYNLDMIISLGYRIKSVIATNFRRWATERLKEYMIKGFTMDELIIILKVRNPLHFSKWYRINFTMRLMDILRQK